MITDLTYLHMEYICLHMREKDAEEILALRSHDSRVLLGWELFHHIDRCGRGAIAWHNGKPAAFAALCEHWGGVWEAFMAGTDDFKAVAMPLARWFRNTANDIIEHHKGHRLQCESRVGYDEAQAYIKALGGVEEGPPMRKYGKDGSDYQRFVWIKGENDQALRPHMRRAA